MKYGNFGFYVWRNFKMVGYKLTEDSAFLTGQVAGRFIESHDDPSAAVIWPTMVVVHDKAILPKIRELAVQYKKLYPGKRALVNAEISTT